MTINEKIKQVADEARLVQVDGHWRYASGDEYDQRFCQLIVERILERVEKEIAVAYDQDEQWTAATLEALALEILDDFDMELPNEC